MMDFRRWARLGTESRHLDHRMAWDPWRTIWEMQGHAPIRALASHRREVTDENIFWDGEASPCLACKPNIVRCLLVS